MLPALTAIKGRSIISYNTIGQKSIGTGGLVDKNYNLLHADTADYMNDVRIFRQKMGKRIESNGQHLSDIKAKIKMENKEANADFFTTIFELNLAIGYMKIKLDDFNPRVADKWKIFKQEFSKEMGEWNIEFADFVSII